MEDQEMFEQVENVLSYLNICFGVLGLLGNLACSRVMLTTPLKHISCSIFFFFMGLSDSIVIMVMVIQDISVHTSLTRDDILFGGNEWRCRFGSYGLETCRTASSWLVVALAAELYLATNNPVEAKIVYSRWRSFRVSIYISLLACAGSLPFLVINTSDGHKCIPQYKIFIDIYSNIIMRPIVIFIFPLVLCGFCLVRVFKTLSSNDRSVIEQQASGSYTDDKVLEELFRHGYQAKTGIVAVSVIFICSVIPSMVLDIAFIVNKYTEENFVNWKWQIAEEIARSLLLLCYCAKFYVILAVEDDFKHALSYVSTCGLAFNSRSDQGKGTKDFHDLATISNGINYVNSNNSNNAQKKKNGFYNIRGNKPQRKRGSYQNTEFHEIS